MRIESIYFQETQIMATPEHQNKGPLSPEILSGKYLVDEAPEVEQSGVAA